MGAKSKNKGDLFPIKHHHKLQHYLFDVTKFQTRKLWSIILNKRNLWVQLCQNDWSPLTISSNKFIVELPTRKVLNGIFYVSYLHQNTYLSAQTSGNALDWVYGRLNVVHTYATELRPHPFVRYNGFEESGREIVPSGTDLMIGVKAVAQYILNERNARH